jgi:hypothetical protein
MRAVMSVLPPAAKGTTIVMGRVGQLLDCAIAHVLKATIEVDKTIFANFFVIMVCLLIFIKSCFLFFMNDY